MPPTPPVAFTSLTVGAPAIAWGLAACAIPVIIHLVLRQRPRRQVFPAMRLLTASQRSAMRARRLRHWLLLLTRMMVIALMVATLMKLGCAPDGHTTAAWLRPAGEPVSAVICLDDSASMGYRFQGRSRFEHARTWAINLLNDPRRFPPDSEVAIVLGASTEKAGISPSPPRPLAPSNRPGSDDQAQDRAAAFSFLTSQAARRQLDVARLAEHDAPVSALLRQAYALIATATHPRREIYLFNDLTRHSWREPFGPPDVPAALFILDVGQHENRNAMLVLTHPPGRTVPAGRPAAITARVRAGDERVEPVVKLSVDGQLRQRVAPGRLEPDSEADVTLTLPPMEKGTHAATITLEPADALDCDNRRYLVLSAGVPMDVAVVVGQPDHQVATLIAAMIAPPALPPAQQIFTVRNLAPHDLAAPTTLTDTLAVLFADPGPVDAAGRAALAHYVRSGGVLVVVPGPNTAVETYGSLADLLPARVESIQACPEPLRLAVTDFTHPFLHPFADPATDSLNDRLVFRRLVLVNPAPASTTLAPFSDGRPALMACTPGRGRVLLLAFSPAREWGQFGTQAAPMIVFLHTLLAHLMPPADDISAFTAGQRVIRRTSDLGSDALLIRRPDTDELRPLPVLEGVAPLPTGHAGEYRLFAAAAAPRPVLHYAVNVAEGESDARRLEPDAVRAHFPGQPVLVADDATALDQSPVAAGPVDLLIPLGLALLVLLLLESLFANSTYTPSSNSSVDS